MRGWQVDISKLTFGGQIDPRRGFEYNTDHPAFKGIYRDFHYLMIPVRGTFAMGNGRLRWISSVGISADILLQSNFVFGVG